MIPVDLTVCRANVPKPPLEIIYQRILMMQPLIFELRQEFLC